MQGILFLRAKRSFNLQHPLTIVSFRFGFRVAFRLQKLTKRGTTMRKKKLHNAKAATTGNTRVFSISRPVLFQTHLDKL